MSSVLANISCFKAQSKSPTTTPSQDRLLLSRAGLQRFILPWLSGRAELKKSKRDDACVKCFSRQQVETQPKPNAMFIFITHFHIIQNAMTEGLIGSVTQPCHQRFFPFLYSEE